MLPHHLEKVKCSNLMHFLRNAITEFQRQSGRPCMRVHVLRRVLSRFERHSRGSPNGTQPSVATMATFENVRPKFVFFFLLPRLATPMFGSFYYDITT